MLHSILGALDRYQYNQYAPHKTLGRIPLVGAGDPYGNPAKTKWKIMVRWYRFDDKTYYN